MANIHFASAMPHAKCYNLEGLSVIGNGTVREAITTLEFHYDLWQQIPACDDGCRTTACTALS